MLCGALHPMLKYPAVDWSISCFTCSAKYNQCLTVKLDNLSQKLKDTRWRHIEGFKRKNRFAEKKSGFFYSDSIVEQWISRFYGSTRIMPKEIKCLNSKRDYEFSASGLIQFFFEISKSWTWRSNNFIWNWNLNF